MFLIVKLMTMLLWLLLMLSMKVVANVVMINFDGVVEDDVVLDVEVDVVDDVVDVDVDVDVKVDGIVDVVDVVDDVEILCAVEIFFSTQYHLDPFFITGNTPD